MDLTTTQYLRLEAMCRPPVVVHHERTEAEEDQMAMEELIRMTEGPEALERYRATRAAKVARAGGAQ